MDSFFNSMNKILEELMLGNTFTHTHTHTYIYIYVYVEIEYIRI